MKYVRSFKKIAETGVSFYDYTDPQYTKDEMPNSMLLSLESFLNDKCCLLLHKGSDIGIVIYYKPYNYYVNEKDRILIKRTIINSSNIYFSDIKIINIYDIISKYYNDETITSNISFSFNTKSLILKYFTFQGYSNIINIVSTISFDCNRKKLKTNLANGIGKFIEGIRILNDVITNKYNEYHCRIFNQKLPVDINAKYAYLLNVLSKNTEIDLNELNMLINIVKSLTSNVWVPTSKVKYFITFPDVKVISIPALSYQVRTDYDYELEYFCKILLLLLKHNNEYQSFITDSKQLLLENL